MENDGVAIDDRVDHPELGSSKSSPEFTQTAVRCDGRSKRERQDRPLAGEKVDVRQDRRSVLYRRQVVKELDHRHAAAGLSVVDNSAGHVSDYRTNAIRRQVPYLTMLLLGVG